MNRITIFTESVSKLGLTKNQLNGVVSLFESIVGDSVNLNDDYDLEPDAYEYKWDPADKAAFEAVKPIFMVSNGKTSKLSRSLRRYWNNELMGCGVDITKVEEYNPQEDNWPKLRFSFDNGREKGTLEIRTDMKGRLSYVIFDEDGRNMNPGLYKFDGTDINQFEDHYECSPKYDIKHIKDLFEESVSKVLTYCTLFRDLGPLVMAGM
ncbi:MAG: hypothetical protein J6Q22_11600 [Prevotella sp.]|nr:hypothetical protein [Prevotella sp.]